MLMQSHNPLEDYRWKNRILLVSADEKSTDLLQTQLNKFRGEDADFTERKLIVINLNANPGKPSNEKTFDKNSIAAIRKAYDVPQQDFHLVLIGLDGGAKKSWQKPVEPTEIYRLIDAMPMRKNNR